MRRLRRRISSDSSVRLLGEVFRSLPTVSPPQRNWSWPPKPVFFISYVFWQKKTSPDSMRGNRKGSVRYGCTWPAKRRVPSGPARKPRAARRSCQGPMRGYRPGPRCCTPRVWGSRPAHGAGDEDADEGHDQPELHQHPPAQGGGRQGPPVEAEVRVRLQEVRQYDGREDPAHHPAKALQLQVGGGDDGKSRGGARRRPGASGQRLRTTRPRRCTV